MKILCSKYSITVPNEDVMRLNPDRTKPMSVELVISNKDNYKYTMYTCTPCLAELDKIADNRWRVDLEGVFEIRTFDN